MMTAATPFKVSVGLKDIIGRELITNDFVAVFELVKNSFDAQATSVNLLFEPDRITITDNGEGMSRKEIIDKWLFVAYSAKRNNTDDTDSRHQSSAQNRPFAGDKGIGRFSCDRLGKQLTLWSRAESSRVQIVAVDWTRYEENPTLEFGDVEVDITEAEDFGGASQPPDGDFGTVLEITNLRSEWPRKKLQGLRRGLAKLINPFASTHSKFEITLVAPVEEATDANKDEDDRVNGIIKNTLVEVLRHKTTKIQVSLSESGDSIETILEDRGEVVYHIREPNTHTLLRHAGIRADVYYLNLSAKTTFARRMGLRSVKYGSIFLFRNGFRMFPIGEEHDDFFGLAWRKQQGVRRFLGTRDVIGRIDVRGIQGFREATSRDQGLIRTPTVVALIDFVLQKCIRRLERYVVDITWKDPIDKEVEDASRMALYGSRERIVSLVSRLCGTKGVRILDYNKNIANIVDAKSRASEDSLTALEVLAEKTGDAALVQRVRAAKTQVEDLRAAEAVAREAAESAEKRAEEAEEGRKHERERNSFLVAVQSLDENTILNLHHQIMVHATGVQLWIERMLTKMRENAPIGAGEWLDFLEAVAFQNKQVLTAARFATKGDYRVGVTETDDNLAAYIQDYIEGVSALWAPHGLTVSCDSDGRPMRRPFRPIDVGIVIDNLVSNATKANARNIHFAIATTGGKNEELRVSVADDGDGWASSTTPLDTVFDKGLTTTRGSGLGLFHVRQVVTAMGGSVEAQMPPYSDAFCGAHLTILLGMR